jgi:hypothetical protein
VTTIDDSSYYAFTLEPGEEPDGGLRLGPRLDSAGTIRTDSADGEQVLTFPVRHLFRHVGVFPDSLNPFQVAEQLAAPRMWTSWSDLTLVVTDSRIAFQARRRESDGKSVMVGHVRYPWMRSVEFAPKRGVFSDSELLIEVYETFGAEQEETGKFLHRFTFQFDKSFHPGELAQTVAQRAARYIASTQPVEQRGALEAMASAERLADPPKREHSCYEMPVSTSYPDGHYGLGDGRDAATWSYRG